MTSIHPIRAEDFDEWSALWDGYLTFYESVVPAEVTARTFRRIVEGDGVQGALARDDDQAALGSDVFACAKAQSSHGNSASRSDVSTVAPAQMRICGGASRWPAVS